MRDSSDEFYPPSRHHPGSFGGHISGSPPTGVQLSSSKNAFLAYIRYIKLFMSRTTTNLVPPDDGTPIVHTGARKPPVLPWPDISSRAKWSVSSFKFGFGAECLLDGDPDTFWQSVLKLMMMGYSLPADHIHSSSDGPQPHFITIEFPRKVAIQVCIHCIVSFIYSSNSRNLAFSSIFPKTIRTRRLLWQSVQELAPVTFRMCVL